MIATFMQRNKYNTANYYKVYIRTKWKYMYKLHALLFLLLLGLLNVNAQPTFNLYSEDADAQQQILDAAKLAREQNKNVFLFVGGSWCKWCRIFNEFAKSDAQIDSAFKAGYITEHINFSKKNKNFEVMKLLEFPQRFGFPVFVILDKSGKRIHTQRTDYLEEGEGYSKQKVLEFLEQWSPMAIEADQYK
ncbi:MAG TPA: thioredoxin family protein [Bacteroidia bacterium]|nr:thioredoxin family protein [Bacteroidia bacterium]